MVMDMDMDRAALVAYQADISGLYQEVPDIEFYRIYLVYQADMEPDTLSKWPDNGLICTEFQVSLHASYHGPQCGLPRGRVARKSIDGRRTAVTAP